MALSSPHNVRDFLYIKDMVSLYFAIAKQLPTSAYVFNAGTGRQCSVQEVVSTVAALLGRPLDVQWGQAASRPWEPTSWQADNSLAKQILQWEPRYYLEQGLAASIAWFKNNSSFYTKKGINDHRSSTEQAAPPANTI
jgi:nucleoside-diphosphate-sugar epimerase